LRRKTSIGKGETDWQQCRQQWDDFPVDNSDDLRDHIGGCGATCNTAIAETAKSKCEFTTYVSGGQETWFSFTASNTDVQIRLVSKPFGTNAPHIHNISLFEGTCANPSLIAQDELPFIAIAEELTIDASGLVPGNTYYIRAKVPASEKPCPETGCPGGSLAAFILCIQNIDVFQPLDFSSILSNFGVIDAPSSSHTYYTNKGQIVDTDGNPRRDIKLYTIASQPNAYVFDDHISYVFAKVDKDTTTDDSLHRVDMTLVGGNTDTRLFKTEKTSGRLNYFLGHVTSGISKIAGYSKAVCNDVYPNIDMQLHSNSAGMKYYFISRPGGDPDDIVMRFDGASSVDVTPDGGLTVATPLGNIDFDPGHAYAINPNGNVIPMPWQAKFEKVSSKSVKFKIHNFNSIMPLIIQVDKGHPLKVAATGQWITYYGGNKSDEGNDLTVDTQGNVYLTGETGSSTFPIDTGAYDTLLSGIGDAFLTKFGFDYSLVWATYFGGDKDDVGYSIDWTSDAGGKVYLCGETSSTRVSFPFIDLLGNSFQDNSTFDAGAGGFIARFNDADGIPDWSTYFVPGFATPRSLKVDASGNVFMSGQVLILTPGDNPTCNASAPNGGLPLCNPQGGKAYFQNFNGGGSFSADIFLTKFNNVGQIQWSTFFGGDQNDWFNSIAIDDNNGLLYLTGTTRSGNFSTPTCQARTDFSFPLCNGGGYFTDEINAGTLTGDEDAFIAKFDLNTLELLWSTYYGSFSSDNGSDVAVNSKGEVYMTGRTTSSLQGTPTCQFPSNQGFPFCPNGYFQTHNGGYDGFIAKFDLNNSLLWSTYIGGTGTEDIGFVPSPRISINSDDVVYLIGTTRSYDQMPILFNDSLYFQPSSMDSGSSVLVSDAYMMSFNSFSNKLEWGSYFGGSVGKSGQIPADGDIGNAIVTFENTRVYVAGFTYSMNDFPISNPGTANPYMQTNCSDCNSTSDAFIGQLSVGEIPTNISKHPSYYNNGSLSVYPNPSNNNITVEINLNAKQNVRLSVYNIIGEEMYSRELKINGITPHKENIDLDMYTDGIYLVNLQSENLNINRKIIKQN
ncbi:MAG: SBBP repeat-containing protein, partial [Flavobacteriales bacterium]|nr:SBBP repeat-containing protein [Flavobacteriales bacterium]